MIGWIKLHRSLIDWEWYDDDNAVRLLVHLLITVNYEDKKWKGENIKAGSRITSWDTLKSELKTLTRQQLRTAMSKLERSGEVTRKATNKFQLITLVKWDKLQSSENEDNRQTLTLVTDKQQANNIQITPTKEVNNINNKRNKEKTIPSFQEFLIYALEKKPKVDQQDLKLKYDSWIENDWKTGGAKPRIIKNWKSSLLNTLPFIKEKSSAQKENSKKDAAQILAEKYGIN